jgi:hypothetical protein
MNLEQKTRKKQNFSLRDLGKDHLTVVQPLSLTLNTCYLLLLQLLLIHVFLLLLFVCCGC